MYISLRKYIFSFSIPDIPHILGGRVLVSQMSIRLYIYIEPIYNNLHTHNLYIKKIKN